MFVPIGWSEPTQADDAYESKSAAGALFFSLSHKVFILFVKIPFYLQLIVLYGAMKSFLFCFFFF